MIGVESQNSVALEPPGHDESKFAFENYLQGM
jgi:hypothetical protein